MANITRHIGLSLAGADICWPICFEEILRRLDLEVPSGGDRIRFEAERLTIEPFDLSQACKYTVVVDRLTHWFHTSREWIKKAVIMDGLYVFNNPWSVQSMEKCTTYCLMMHLGLPVPPTWLVPPKEAPAQRGPGEHSLTQYARMFDLPIIGKELGYPLYMKPYDGGAWVGVSQHRRRGGAAASLRGERNAGHAPAAGGPRLRSVRALSRRRAAVLCHSRTSRRHRSTSATRSGFNVVDGDEWQLLQDMTLTINSIFGWDFNSCECLRQDGEFMPIDFANPCPDSQVTSLNYHFPWIVKAKLAWSVYCAATLRPMRRNLDWEPFYEVRRRGLPYREQLRAYAEIAEKRLDMERFREFRETHLAHLDEVALEFFGTDTGQGSSASRRSWPSSPRTRWRSSPSTSGD